MPATNVHGLDAKLSGFKLLATSMHVLSISILCLSYNPHPTSIICFHYYLYILTKPKPDCYLCRAVEAQKLLFRKMGHKNEQHYLSEKYASRSNVRYQRGLILLRLVVIID